MYSFVVAVVVVVSATVAVVVVFCLHGDVYVYVHTNWLSKQLTLQLCQVTVLLAVKLFILVQRILVIYLIGTHAIPIGAIAAIFAKRIRLQYGLFRRLPIHIMQLSTAAELFNTTITH